MKKEYPWTILHAFDCLKMELLTQKYSLFVEIGKVAGMFCGLFDFFLHKSKRILKTQPPGYHIDPLDLVRTGMSSNVQTNDLQGLEQCLSSATMSWFNPLIVLFRSSSYS